VTERLSGDDTSTHVPGGSLMDLSWPGLTRADVDAARSDHWAPPQRRALRLGGASFSVSQAFRHADRAGLYPSCRLLRLWWAGTL
jgi:hypothetical protein